MTLRAAGVELELPRGWARLDELPDVFTVANRASGVGALQISTTAQIADSKPSLGDLRGLIAGLSERNGLGAPLEAWYFDLSPLRGAVATFHHGDDLVRVWSGSDGRSFALATYVCRKGLEHVEADAVDALVRSLRFCSAAGVS